MTRLCCIEYILCYIEIIFIFIMLVYFNRIHENVCSVFKICTHVDRVSLYKSIEP